MSQNAGFEMNKLETNETNPKIMTSQCSPPQQTMMENTVPYLTTLEGLLAAAVQNVTLKLCNI